MPAKPKSKNACVRLTHATVMPPRDGIEEEFIINGYLDTATIGAIKADTYQREVGKPKRIEQLATAVAKNQVPEIKLAMRGQDFTHDKSGTLTLLNDVYVVDGLQRLSAARLFLSEGNTYQPRIRAAVTLDTTRPVEKQKFVTLNTGTKPLAGNVLLKNLAEDYTSGGVLKSLTETITFPLYGKVCWKQDKTKDHLLSAYLYVHASTLLHTARFGGNAWGNPKKLATLDKLVAVMGEDQLRQNAITYWETIDRCWGIRECQPEAKPPQLKNGFLFALAHVFAEHNEFWNDNAFTVDSDMIFRLRNFKLNIPEINALCGRNAGNLLFFAIVDKLNKGKRVTQYLTRAQGKGRKAALKPLNPPTL